MHTILVCPPDYFSVACRDPHNKYMDPENQPIRKITRDQHVIFRDLFKTLGQGIMRMRAYADAPDMTFTRNAGFPFKRPSGENVIILSNFLREHRQPEKGYYRAFFSELGYTIKELPESLSFEGGGDASIYRPPGKNPVVLCGYGFRTSRNALEHIERITELPVVPLKLKNVSGCDKVPYHRDTMMIELEREETFIVYTDAMTKGSLKRLERYGTIIPATVDDFENLALNSVVLNRDEIHFTDMCLPKIAASVKIMKQFFHEHKNPMRGIVVLSEFASVKLQIILWGMGYYPAMVPMTEFMKSGGSVGCLTLQLP